MEPGRGLLLLGVGLWTLVVAVVPDLVAVFFELAGASVELATLLSAIVAATAATWVLGSAWRERPHTTGRARGQRTAAVVVSVLALIAGTVWLATSVVQLLERGP